MLLVLVPRYFLDLRYCDGCGNLNFSCVLFLLFVEFLSTEISP